MSFVGSRRPSVLYLGVFEPPLRSLALLRPSQPSASIPDLPREDPPRTSVPAS